MTIKQDLKDIEQQRLEEQGERFRQRVLDWEIEVRESRSLNPEEKVEYNRPVFSTMWATTHSQDMKQPIDWVPEQPWEEFKKIALPFFQNHQKRIYVDSHLWIDLLKPEHNISIFGEQVSFTIIRTIANERELARRDGEYYENNNKNTGSVCF